MTRTLHFADLFCGAGGTSTGSVEACEALGYHVELTAINHWDIAVATHSKNHPGARHLCTGIDNVNPRDLYLPGELDILWASPECTHHSVARGGKPINDQSRSTAWCVIRWAEALRPGIILIENVPEYVTWGPCNAKGKPIKARKGEIFRSWIANLKAIGYTVEWRILRAADFGDPTTRRRLFVQAVRGRRRIVWPNPTHAEHPVGTLKPWIPAADIIDWRVKGASIYGRKRNLVPKTMERIYEGLFQFGLSPFIIPQQAGGKPAHSVGQPVPTITTTSRGIGVAQPFLVKLRGTNNAADITKPAPTITSGGNHLGVAQPYLVQTNHGNGPDKTGKANKRRVRPVTKPMPTVNGTRGEWGVCEPFLVSPSHGKPPGVKQEKHRARSINRPLPTVAAAGVHWGVCEPFIIGIDHKGGNGNQTTAINKPLSTVTSKQRHAVCEPFITIHRGKSKARSVHAPAPTVTGTGAGHLGLAQPFITTYYGNGGNTPVSSPLGTVTSKERFALCEPMLLDIGKDRYQVDILFRMLMPSELALAQGFRADYQFQGNATETVKQIGNAVPRNLVRAIVKAVVSQNPNV